MTNELEIDVIAYKNVPLFTTPPWLFSTPAVTMETKEMYSDTTRVYTDALKDSDGKTGVAAYIPDDKVSIKKSI